MATRKKCVAGHQGCSCTMSCCTLDPARAQQIKEDAQSGTRWSAEVEKGFGASPACRCGVRRKTLATTVHGRDDGSCPVHPKETE